MAPNFLISDWIPIEGYGWIYGKSEVLTSCSVWVVRFVLHFFFVSSRYSLYSKIDKDRDAGDFDFSKQIPSRSNWSQAFWHPQQLVYALHYGRLRVRALAAVTVCQFSWRRRYMYTAWEEVLLKRLNSRLECPLCEGRWHATTIQGCNLGHWTGQQFQCDTCWQQFCLAVSEPWAHPHIYPSLRACLSSMLSIA